MESSSKKYSYFAAFGFIAYVVLGMIRKKGFSDLFDDSSGWLLLLCWAIMIGFSVLLLIGKLNSVFFIPFGLLAAYQAYNFIMDCLVEKNYTGKGLIPETLRVLGPICALIVFYLILKKYPKYYLYLIPGAVFAAAILAEWIVYERFHVLDQLWKYTLQECIYVISMHLMFLWFCQVNKVRQSRQQ